MNTVLKEDTEICPHLFKNCSSACLLGYSKHVCICCSGGVLLANTFFS